MAKQRGATLRKIVNHCTNEPTFHKSTVQFQKNWSKRPYRMPLAYNFISPCFIGCFFTDSAVSRTEFHTSVKHGIQTQHFFLFYPASFTQYRYPQGPSSLGLRGKEMVVFSDGAGFEPWTSSIRRGCSLYYTNPTRATNFTSYCHFLYLGLKLLKLDQFWMTGCRPGVTL